MMNYLKAGAAGLMLLSVAGCTTTETGAAVGAGTGAIIGGATTGSTQGALAGAAIGGITGALIGRAATPGDCIYRDSRGRRFIAPCG
jgi:surface antigen